MHGRPRHAIFTVPGGEGIEAFKRRTLDTTRHLTCSGTRLRKPLSLSGVSYLFRDTPVLRAATRSLVHPLSPLVHSSFSPFATPPTFPLSPCSSLSPPTLYPIRVALPSSFSLSVAARDLLVIQNLRTLVALPAAYWCTHTRPCGRARTRTHACTGHQQPSAATLQPF